MRAGLFCGVMSGTSLDGIDAALIRFSRGAARIVAVARGRFRPALRRELLALCEKGDDEIERAQIAANEIARAYAAVVVDLARRAPGPIIAVGAHGQTIRHRPRAGFSTQLLNGALLAELTGIDVVCDFRARDIAARGQGAPLACGFHQFAFARLAPCAVINIGGVANATILRPDEPARGWDVGPGNMLMDAWNQKHKNTPFDRGGEWARQTQPSSRLLRRLLESDGARRFLRRRPPKSCGREEFDISRFEPILRGEDAGVAQATLLEFTAATIAAEIRKTKTPLVILCGGGAKNDALVARLRDLARPARVCASDEVGIAAEHIEAAAFAYLARLRILRLPANTPSATGARGERILGALHCCK